MSVFVQNHPHPETGINKMTHNHSPGHDCSKCEKPTCTSNLLLPPEPLVNVNRDDDHVTDGQGNERYPGRLFDDGNLLPPSPPLIDEHALVEPGQDSSLKTYGTPMDRGKAQPLSFGASYPML